MSLFPKLFNRSNNSFHDFISAIKQGERNLFALINVPETDFQTASFDQLMANEGDVLSGVNKVLIRLNRKYFDFFENCLVKYHDNGDLKFVFFTTTSNADRIIDFAKVLFELLGQGIYHDEKFIPFTNNEKIHDLSKNKYSSFKDLWHLWTLPDVNFVLQYKITPLREFSLMTTLRAPAVIDRSIRSKGSVLSLIDFDIHAVLRGEPQKAEPHYHEGEISSISYTYFISQGLTNIFDRVEIRLFGTDRKFADNKQCNVSLYASYPLSYKQKVDLVQELIRIYGSDNHGSSDLETHELDIIEAKEFWVGRNWSLNTAHTIWNMENKSESMLYQVSVFEYGEEKGFQLDILGFNELYSMFSGK